jgi:hypothetical protein
MHPEGLIEELLHPPVDEFTTPSRRLGQRVFRAALSVALLGAGIFTGLVATVALPSTAEGAVTGQVSQATDPNWAGYIGLGGYQAVSTTLVVPTVTCAPGENSSSSFWAGIGGYQSASVEQAGVESACQGGRPAYWAWWEEYGGAASSGPLSSVLVHPGDTVTATVVDLGGGSYAMAVTDTTSHTTQSATATEAGADDDSVECIAEDPSGTGSQVPYANYGTVAFSSCLAGGVSSHLGTMVSGGSPVGAGNLVQITGITGGNGVNAAVSPMSKNTSFTVTREFPPVYTPPLADPVVGIASMPDGGGYWLVNGSGAVSAHGAAQFYGSMAGHPLVSPIAHIMSSPTGHGYWMVAADGGVFCFGDAGFYGSMGGQHLNMPVVSLAPAPGGHGYWLVASDGGVFAFGAPFYGSMGGQLLNKPMVGIALDRATGGYWLVASEGGVFAFNTPFLGSTGATGVASPVLSLDATASGNGYRFVSADGGIFCFGDAGFCSGLSAVTPTNPTTGMAEDLATGGYWLLTADGTVTPFNATWFGNF